MWFVRPHRVPSIFDMTQPAFAGIDVAFAKGKHLPIVVCTWQGERLIPFALRRLDFEPPVGLGNAASCKAGVVENFAQAAVNYLRQVEAHFDVQIIRIGIDAPSDPRSQTVARRAAEAALDRAGISCFTTPSDADFILIRQKVERHLASGGAESRLPHANQLWMLVGFQLFRQLKTVAECVEVYPQATVQLLGVGKVHKFKQGGVATQLAAASAYTGWPRGQQDEPIIDEIAWAPSHDKLDAYLAAWVAALDESDRLRFGTPPHDVIWAPHVKRREPPIVMKPSAATPMRVTRLLTERGSSSIQVPRKLRPRQCPACPKVFRDFPLGWDAHAAHRCPGLEAQDPEVRKREYKSRFGHLFI